MGGEKGGGLIQSCFEKGCSEIKYYNVVDAGT